MTTNQTIIREMVERRGKNVKHYLLADGSYQAVFFSGQVHYTDQYGNLQNIDTRLYDEADFDLIDWPVTRDKKDEFFWKREEVLLQKGKRSLDRAAKDFHGLRVPFGAMLPRQFRRGYSIWKESDRLSIKPIGASPSTGHVSEERPNVIEYQDAWNDVDVRLELTDRGIKVFLTLKTSISQTKFSFEIVGNIADDLKAGVLELQPAWLVDFNGEYRDVAQSIRREGEKVFIDLEADVQGLAYPVVIDPTVTLQPPVLDTYTYDAEQAGQTHGTDTTIKVGSSSSYAYRSFLKFDLSQISAGSYVTSAVLTLTKSTAVSTGSTFSVDVYNLTTDFTNANIPYNAKPVMGTKIVSSASYLPTSFPAALDLDITSSVREMVLGTRPNYGWGLRASTEGLDGRVDFYSTEYATASSRPKLVITYNAAPGAPTVTAPNGGETLNAQSTITWTPATDLETTQASLQYNIELSTDNGTTWKTIIALTVAGATSYAYDFTNEAQSSTCLIRIRAYDGSAYGPWDQSNGVFTIQHNAAPSAPTNLAPASGVVLDRAAFNRLTWTHNDPNGDPQSKFDLQWRVKGTTVWNTVTLTTTSQYFDAPGNTFPRGDIEWQVRTYDQAGLSGPYSAQAVFSAGDKPPAPTFISPINGDTVGLARPLIQWSSPDQVWYQLQVLQGASTSWDPGAKQSTNKAETCGIDLANNTNYTIKLRIKNADGIWSDWISAAITASYTPPAVPTVSAVGSEGRIRLSIIDSAPTGTQPAVIGHDIFRRRADKQENFARIAVSIAKNGTFDDYTVASGVPYQYFVRTFGANTTFSDSAATTTSVTLSGVWLHAVEDPAGTVYNFRFNENRNVTPKVQAERMQFAGRSRPVTEFGETDEFGVKFDLSLRKEDSDCQKLYDLFWRKTTICYRDARGRRVFGTIVELPGKEQWWGDSMSLEIWENDYSEVV